MEVNELTDPTTCQTLLLFSLSQVFGKPNGFPVWGDLCTMSENSPLAKPCDNIYEEFQKIQTFFAKVHFFVRFTQ